MGIIKEMILKADYQPVTIINEQRSKLMFKTEDVTNPIYEKDKDGNIVVDDKGNPIIIGYEDTDYCNVLVTYFRGERTEAAMRKLISDWYNPEIDQKILNGFVWNDMNVWLSTENQFNYKAEYDLAVQSEGKNLPVTFKFGTDTTPIYYEFKTFEELEDFYTSAIKYISDTYKDGWEKKEAFDWSLYTE